MPRAGRATLLLVLFSLTVGIATAAAAPPAGHAVAWGRNDWGQLGNTVTGNTPVPGEVAALKTIAARAAGGLHTVAALSDGTVRAWGRNEKGQLGNGCNLFVPQGCSNELAPVKVLGLTNIIAVAAGARHSLALDADGFVWAWGDNAAGQLGNQTLTPSSKPVKVTFTGPLPPGIASIAAGGDHSLAVTRTGLLLVWGANDKGQLGINTQVNKNVPTFVFALSKVTGVAGGARFSVARLVDGTVWTWGSNSAGQLGNDGSGPFAKVPSKVPALNDVVAVAAGKEHVVTAKRDGTVWSWGANSSGQLGVKATFPSSGVPVATHALTGIVAVSAGDRHSLAVDAKGKVFGWGEGGAGQLGDGATVGHAEPIAVPGLTGVTAVAAGGEHSVASPIPGTLFSWGDGGAGGLGNGAWLSRLAPGQVNGLTWVSAVAIGSSHGLALRPGGRVWGWGGDNTLGVLGNGGPVFQGTSALPFAVPVGTAKSGYLKNVVAIAATVSTSLALVSDGRALAWGLNSFGQIGDGTTQTRLTPVEVKLGTPAKAIAMGSEFGLALAKDGTVRAWGAGTLGQLGWGNSFGSLVPVKVKVISGVTGIAAGDGHALAVTADGRVWAWGQGKNGQLGDGCTLPPGCPNTNVPKQVMKLTNIVAVAAGATGSMALGKDGTVWTWGWNEVGQLGNGCPLPGGCKDSSIPIAVPGLPPIKAIAASAYHRLAVAASDGALWAWGSGSSGELGDGSGTSSSTPKPVALAPGVSVIGGVGAGVGLAARPAP